MNILLVGEVRSAAGLADAVRLIKSSRDKAHPRDRITLVTYTDQEIPDDFLGTIRVRSVAREDVASSIGELIAEAKPLFPYDNPVRTLLMWRLREIAFGEVAPEFWCDREIALITRPDLCFGRLRKSRDNQLQTPMEYSYDLASDVSFWGPGSKVEVLRQFPKFLFEKVRLGQGINPHEALFDFLGRRPGVGWTKTISGHRIVAYPRRHSGLFGSDKIMSGLSNLERFGHGH